MEANTIKVIVVYDKESTTYFTMEGVEIGTLRGGVRETPVPIVVNNESKGAIIRARTPKQVKTDNDREAEKFKDSLINRVT